MKKAKQENSGAESATGNQASDKTDAPETISRERLFIALEAAWETEALTLRMIDMCGLDRLDFRGIAARILALSRATMAALEDPNDELKDIRRRLGCANFGETTGET